ncbi:MAG: hypothetical protein WC052_01810 [Patescibacteria group bacterium]
MAEHEAVQPFIADSLEELTAVRLLLYEIGTDEMHWPEEEVIPILRWPQQILVGVRAAGELVAAGQILVAPRPFPVESFEPGCITHSARPVEVSLVGIERAYRRKAQDGAMAVLDALVKAIYWGCHSVGFTDIWALYEPTRILIFDQIAGIPVVVETVGQHYWCSREVHTPDCPLTYGCRMNRLRGEANWLASRPEFYAYVMAGM